MPITKRKIKKRQKKAGKKIKKMQKKAYKELTMQSKDFQKGIKNIDL